VTAVQLVEASSGQTFDLWGAEHPPLLPGSSLSLGRHALTLPRDGHALTIGTRYANDFIARVQVQPPAGPPRTVVAVSPGCGAPDDWSPDLLFDGHILVTLDGSGGEWQAEAAIGRVRVAAGPRALVSQAPVKTVGRRWFTYFTIAGHPSAVTWIARQVEWTWSSHRLGTRRIDASCRGETGEIPAR
jgi:hypothetical protein